MFIDVVYIFNIFAIDVFMIVDGVRRGALGMHRLSHVPLVAASGHSLGARMQVLLFIF